MCDFNQWAESYRQEVTTICIRVEQILWAWPVSDLEGGGGQVGDGDVLQVVLQRVDE